MQTIVIHEAVQGAFNLNTLKASDEERFAARIYLRVALKRMRDTAMLISSDPVKLEAYAAKLNKRIAELA